MLVEMVLILVVNKHFITIHGDEVAYIFFWPQLSSIYPR